MPRRIWRQDHAGVAPGAHERAVADGLARRPPGRRRRPSSSSHDRLEGEGHVGAGVAVGHRVDVEPVDAGLVGAPARPRKPETTARRSAAPRRVERSPSRRDRRPIVRWAPVPATALTPVPFVRGLRYRVMAAVCEVCGKHPSFGMSVSHSHRRTKRRWNPNIQRVRAVVDGTTKRVNVCTSCIKAGKVAKAAPLDAADGRPDRARRDQVLRPGTRSRRGRPRHRPGRVRPRRPTRSRARSSACSARASGSSSTSTTAGRATQLRLGSEVDMGTPGFPQANPGSAQHPQG